MREWVKKCVNFTPNAWGLAGLILVLIVDKSKSLQNSLLKNTFSPGQFVNYYPWIIHTKYMFGKENKANNHTVHSNLSKMKSKILPTCWKETINQEFNNTCTSYGMFGADGG